MTRCQMSRSWSHNLKEQAPDTDTMGNCTARAYDEPEIRARHFERSPEFSMINPDGGEFRSRLPADTLQPLYDEDLEIQFGQELARSYITETNLFLSRMPVIAE